MIAGVLSVFSRLLQYLADNPYILGVLVLLCVFILALSVFFSGPKPAKNPFSIKNVRPVEQLVSDQKERDRVLKQSMYNFFEYINFIHKFFISPQHTLIIFHLIDGRRYQLLHYGCLLHAVTYIKQSDIKAL